VLWQTHSQVGLEPAATYSNSNFNKRLGTAVELQASDTKDNPWLRDLAYQEAFEALQQVLPYIETRLEFSNGDWQPGNFLAHRGEITGFLDFESALFQDPLREISGLRHVSACSYQPGPNIPCCARVLRGGF
jgi:aminoglycoside phosphotransferase (APT) family kinase protein